MLAKGVAEIVFIKGVDYRGVFEQIQKLHGRRRYIGMRKRAKWRSVVAAVFDVRGKYGIIAKFKGTNAAKFSGCRSVNRNIAGCCYFGILFNAAALCHNQFVFLIGVTQKRVNVAAYVWGYHRKVDIKVFMQFYTF